MKTIELPLPETIKAAQVAPLMCDLKETATLLSCSTKSVRRLIRRGLLRPCTALRKILIPRKQIEEFIQVNCPNPKTNGHRP